MMASKKPATLEKPIRIAVKELRWLDIDDFLANPDNPKIHPGEQQDGIAGSIDTIGFADALSVNLRTSELWPPGQRNVETLLDGHARVTVLLRAAERQQLPKIPTLMLDLTPEEERQFLVSFDWLATQSKADKEKTENLLRQVQTDDARVSEMLAEVAKSAGLDYGKSDVDAEPQIDKAEELRAKWGVELGQLWQLGDHRLICGDCTDRAVVEKVMRGERAGACATDPPYGINREGIENDDPEGLSALFDGCLNAAPIENAVVIAFQSPRLFPVWLDAIRRADHKFERMLWMYKPNDETFPWRGWLLKSEAILLSSVGNPEWLRVDPFAHDVYSPTTIGKELEKSDGWHASVKPMAVVCDLLSRIGGAIIYEPFSGSGTTIIACERLGRKCRAIEISPAYVAVALERWANATGKTPVLLEV